MSTVVILVLKYLCTALYFFVRFHAWQTLMVHILLAELDSTQLILAQPFHEGAERGHRQELMVGGQP